MPVSHASTRRELLRSTGALFAWTYAPRVARAEGRDPRFLTIVLRGGLDGLAVVAPVGDADWIKLRGDNALKLDGESAALPLDGFFALNPAMPNLHRLYKAGRSRVALSRALAFRRAGCAGKRACQAGQSGIRLAQSRSRGPRTGRAGKPAWPTDLRGRSHYSVGRARAGARVVMGAAAAAARER
jgi:uncharacterized protein (DUF1501 family)